jgi:hypothetical protein
MMACNTLQLKRIWKLGKRKQKMPRLNLRVDLISKLVTAKTEHYFMVN